MTTGFSPWCFNCGLQHAFEHAFWYLSYNSFMMRYDWFFTDFPCPAKAEKCSCQVCSCNWLLSSIDYKFVQFGLDTHVSYDICVCIYYMQTQYAPMSGACGQEKGLQKPCCMMMLVMKKLCWKILFGLWSVARRQTSEDFYDPPHFGISLNYFELIFCTDL